MSDSTNKGITNSWTLIEFARKYGRMKVTSEFTNSATGETFRSCAFIAPSGNITLVGFSSQLGELSAKQISARKDTLQVVKLKSGSYKLCETGSDGWEDVDLGL